MDEQKHGLYKVTDQADRMARLVMDQLAKDGCANLENIRNALMAPLITIEQDHDFEIRLMKGVDKLAGMPPRDRFMPREAKHMRDVSQAAHEAMAGHLIAWRVKADGNRYAVAMNAEMRKAFAAAIATNGPMRVSISDGTYVMPDGEVLSELEMIKRSGTDGRARS